MSANKQQEEYDLIGNILSDEEHEAPQSPAKDSSEPK